MAASKPRGWRIFVDRGGTFTDVVALDPDGRAITRKVLSDNPGRYDDAVIEGIREAAGLGPDDALAALDLEEVRIGTTVATNALLERRGARTALVVTRGFGDALRIGYQNRPKLFVRKIELPEPLYERVIEVDERIAADGSVITRLDEARVRKAFASAVADGVTSAAIVLMHGYRFPDHERVLARLAREAGFEYVSASHEASPLIRFVARGQTTVADAYLTPKLAGYTESVAAALPGGRLFFMQSNGGLAHAAHFKGHNAIVSGPAGGIVGAARVSESAGFPRIIAFDMGGTSTDVSHYDGVFEREPVTTVGGLQLQAPTLSIHTVAAGGGSKLEFDGARFRAGPGSGGADPGPACYRKGGPLTVTDCNVMVGKIQPAFFPRIFGPGFDQEIDAATVKTQFAALADDVRSATGQDRAPEEVAEGFLTVAVQNMANAIKQVSVQQGRDVTRYVLCCFGGAGGQHACLVADALGMTQVLVPAMAGVLSAVGLSLAEIRTLKQRSVEAPLKEFDDFRFNALFDPLEDDCREELRRQGVLQFEFVRRVLLRYRGSDTNLPVPYVPGPLLARHFQDAHLRRFGFSDPDTPLEIAAVEIEGVGPGGPGVALGNAAATETAKKSPRPAGAARMFSGGKWHETSIYARDDLAPGAKVSGPAIITEADATTVVEPGWRAEVLPQGHLLLARGRPLKRAAVGGAVDPVMLEVFHGHFTAIAERMGATLANTAHSVNIKERFDFSCAIFDSDGALVANAPHVPVHLGSMGESVRAIMAQNGDSMRPGDSFALNAPYRGGTHLPDITVVTPVFDTKGAEIQFYVASRGHHADVGGITPGSMPPESKTIDEEGILIDGIRIVAGGRFLESDVRTLLGAGQWPARNPNENVSDLKAQVAANATGAEELRALIAAYSFDVVRSYMRHVQDNAEESVRRVLDVLKDGRFTAKMDDGSEICVAIKVDKAARAAAVDFSGTSPQRPDNLNAPSAVTQAAVLYVFRTLVEDDIPLNDGCFKPLSIVVPEGSLLGPKYPAAVAGGNVETSQCMVDAMFAAVNAMAASQGTMNNFTFGNARLQYYETLCGGAGAGPGFDGASAVHTHMTNSRLTDAEILESRFPVLIEAFEIRRGSGGAGAFHGGDGVVRKVRFLAPMEAAILSTRRKIAPFGLAGGGDGEPGRNYILRSGRREDLPGTATVMVNAGDIFVIETPGGGGFGRSA